jgi:hypothetical protein
MMKGGLEPGWRTLTVSIRKFVDTCNDESDMVTLQLHIDETAFNELSQNGSDDVNARSHAIQTCIHSPPSTQSLTLEL